MTLNVAHDIEAVDVGFFVDGVVFSLFSGRLLLIESQNHVFEGHLFGLVAAFPLRKVNHRVVSALQINLDCYRVVQQTPSHHSLAGRLV